MMASGTLGGGTGAHKMISQKTFVNPPRAFIKTPV
jgi:hypothetical protein